MTTPEEDTELMKLGEAISEPAFRQSFADHYQDALRQRSIKTENIPTDVLNALTKLSVDELGVLSTVKDALTKSGASHDVKAEMV